MILVFAVLSGSPAHAAPAGWTCGAQYYDDNDCDCGCGVFDPACDNATIGACDYCNSVDWGGCAESTSCPTNIDPTYNATCVAPPSWTCPEGFFNDGFCDCGCGFKDVDCTDLSVEFCDYCNTSQFGGCAISDSCPSSIDTNDNATCMTNRVVCFDLTFREGRDDLASNTPVVGDPGSIRGIDSGADVTAIGHLYQLWDKDATGGDDFIGQYVKTTPGRGCVSFEWDLQPYAWDDGGNPGFEANPDVYVVYVNEVSSTQMVGDTVRAVSGTSLTPVAPISFRDGEPGDNDKFVAVDCAAGSNCMILPVGQALAITDEILSTRAERVMAGAIPDPFRQL